MAPANVILQAGPRMRPRQVHRAGRNAKSFVDEMYDAIRKAVGKIRPEVDGAVLDQSPRNIHARVFLEGRVTNVRVGLVVAKQDVELRFILLDQAVFQRQGFAVVVHHDIIEVRDFANQRAGLGVQPA